MLSREWVEMFDFHSHILPNIDDGSRSVQESLAMVEELTRQGATGIAATPHFYAQHTSPDRFFEKRSVAWEKLKPYLRDDFPEIRLGAEVCYFEGINRYEGLERFCIDGTNLLLLEMPFCAWTGRMVAAVVEMNARKDLHVLLAHIERYLPYGNWAAWEHLVEQGVFIQASTAFFIEKRRKALKMMRNGYIHFWGTDAHNMDARKPNLAPAVDSITRKSGNRWIAELEAREETVLHETKKGMDHLHCRGASDKPHALRKFEKPTGR